MSDDDDDGESVGSWCGSKIQTRCNKRVSEFIVTWPAMFFASQILIHLVICGILGVDGDLVSKTDDKDWLVPGDSIVQIFDAFEQAKKDNDPIAAGINVLRSYVVYYVSHLNTHTISTTHTLHTHTHTHTHSFTKHTHTHTHIHTGTQMKTA